MTPWPRSSGARAMRAAPLHHLHVVDSVTHAPKWTSPELSGPVYGLDFGDVRRRDSQAGLRRGCRLRTVKPSSPCTTPSPNAWSSRSRFPPAWAACRVSAAPTCWRRQLFITTSQAYQGILIGYDTSDAYGAVADEPSCRPDLRVVQVADLDGDGWPELVAGVKVEHAGAPGAYVYAYDAASGALRWQSPRLRQGFATLSLLRVADVSGDSRPRSWSPTGAAPLDPRRARTARGAHYRRPGNHRPRDSRPRPRRKVRDRHRHHGRRPARARSAHRCRRERWGRSAARSMGWSWRTSTATAPPTTSSAVGIGCGSSMRPAARSSS